jgi:hypothetical protein
MHLNRRSKGEIWNLSAAEKMPAISLGWKTVQEQVVSSCALVLETEKMEDDELKTAAVEDKYVGDYPIDKRIENST